MSFETRKGDEAKASYIRFRRPRHAAFAAGLRAARVWTHRVQRPAVSPGTLGVVEVRAVPCASSQRLVWLSAMHREIAEGHGDHAVGVGAQVVGHVGHDV